METSGGFWRMLLDKPLGVKLSADIASITTIVPPKIRIESSTIFSHQVCITSGSVTRCLKNISSGAGRFLKKLSNAFSSLASSVRTCSSLPSSLLMAFVISFNASSSDMILSRVAAQETCAWVVLIIL